MALLKILEFPDPKLRQRASEVTVFDNTLKNTCGDMLETMYNAKGIGLAAIQVNILKRIVVIDLSEEKNNPLIFINPEIVKVSDDTKQYGEGCLSVPGIYENVTRPNSIIGKYYDVDGHDHQLEADGLLSVCLQHEIDHLNGRVFVDHLSRLKQEKIIRKLHKEKRRSLAEA
tara:strand:- start:2070 stop:2585 length:516 start_codon:yes stop_codon:yes gene_type:complete